MALNSSKKMAEYDFQTGLQKHNHSTDVFKWVFLTNVYSSIDANASSCDLSGFTKVASGGNYTQDSTLTNSTWTRSGAVSTLDYDDVAFAGDASNPTTGKTLAIYNSTVSGEHVYKVVDMTTDDGVTAANMLLGFNWTVNASGAGTATTNA